MKRLGIMVTLYVRTYYEIFDQNFNQFISFENFSYTVTYG